MKRRNSADRKKSTKKAKSLDQEKPISDDSLSYLDWLEREREPEPEPEPEYEADGPNLSDKEGLRRQTIEFAEYALNHYNHTHGTKYELVDPITSCAILRNVVWGHCNFTARNKNTSQDAPPKLFFAELRFPSDARYEPPSFDPLVTVCLILRGKKHIACNNLLCGKYLKHPPYGLFGAKRAYSLRSGSRQRSGV